MDTFLKNKQKDNKGKFSVIVLSRISTKQLFRPIGFVKIGSLNDPVKGRKNQGRTLVWTRKPHWAKCFDTFEDARLYASDARAAWGSEYTNFIATPSAL